MKVSSSFATLAVTLALLAAVSAETNVTPAEPDVAKSIVRTATEVKSTAQKSLGYALNLASKASTLAGQATRGTVRYVQKNPKKIALAAGALYAGHHIGGEMKHEKMYLNRYHRMKSREFVEPSKLKSASFIIDDEGLRDYYTHMDEAARLIEEAYDEYYEKHPTYSFRPKPERLAVRALMRQLMLGHTRPGTVYDAVSRSTVLIPHRTKILELLIMGSAVYCESPNRYTDFKPRFQKDFAYGAGSEDGARSYGNDYGAGPRPGANPFFDDDFFDDFFRRFHAAREPTAAEVRLETLRNRIKAELKGDESLKELKQIKRTWLLRHRQDRSQHQGGDGIDMADARQIFDDLIAAEEAKLAKLQMVQYRAPFGI